MTAPILTYALTSTPNPLGVSSTNGQITITASNNAREFVNLSKIEIQIPGPGSASYDLTEQTGGYTITMPTGWRGDTGNSTSNTLIFYPDNVAGIFPVTTDGLEFVIGAIEVNSEPGNPDVTIKETSVSPLDGSGDPPVTGTTTLQCVKTNVSFALGDLIANPAVVNAGQATSLEWQATGAASYTLEPAELLDNPPDPLAPNTPIATKGLTQNVVFTVTASTSDTGSYLAQSQVAVTAETPTVLNNTVTASASSVNPGESVTLAWQTENADSVIVYASGMQIAVTNDINATAFEVWPNSATTDYTIMATFGDQRVSNPAQSIESLPATVRLNPPVISTFQSTVTPVFAESTVFLTWETQNANYCELIDEHGTITVVPTACDAYEVDGYTSQTFTLKAVFVPVAQQPNQAAAAQKSGVLVTEQSYTLPYELAAIQVVAKTGISDGDTPSFTFETPVESYILCLTGFSYSFSDGSDHSLKKISGEITATGTSGDITSVQTTAAVIFKDNSSHSQSSSTVIDVVAIGLNKGGTGIQLNSNSSSGNKDAVTVCATQGVETPLNALTSFAISQSSDDKVSGLNMDAGKCSVSGSSYTTSVYTAAYRSGSIDGTYSGSGEIGSIAKKSGLDNGLAIKTVNFHTSNVTFDYPVHDAVAVIHQFFNKTNSHNNHIEKLWSDTVNATVDNSNSKQVNLDWSSDSAGWKDNHTTWSGGTVLYVIARYALPGSS